MGDGRRDVKIQTALVFHCGRVNDWAFPVQGAPWTNLFYQLRKGLLILSPGSLAASYCVQGGKHSARQLCRTAASFSCLSGGDRANAAHLPPDFPDGALRSTEKPGEGGRTRKPLEITSVELMFEEPEEIGWT